MRYSASLALSIVILLLLTPWAWAHNEQEETELELSVEGRSLSLVYSTQFPNTAGYTRLLQMDRDQNKQYSESEKDAFLKARAQDYLRKIDVKLNNQAVQLQIVEQSAEINSNLVGLEKLKVHYTVKGTLASEPKAGETLLVEDRVFGWNEVKLSGRSAKLEGDIPGDRLKVTFQEGSGEAVNIGEKGQEHSSDEQLMSLVSGELSPKILISTLGLAFVLGGLHALTPGHGKTLVAAYLVGSKGTIFQAILLGVVVTITHTFSVFLLGIACLFAFEYVLPDKIIPWLGFISGLLVTAVGLALIWARATGRELFHGHSHENGHGHSHGHAQAHEHSHDHSHAHEHKSDHSHDHSHAHEHKSDHSHEHSHGHDHEHSHDHSHQHSAHLEAPEGPQTRDVHELSGAHSHTHNEHLSETDTVSQPELKQVESKVEEKVSLWALVSLGVSGGMVPCPEALVVLLGAISLNRLALGLAVLISFSAGLASILILIGIFVVMASSRVNKKYYPSEDVIRKVSIVSYCFICVLGLLIAVRSLTSAGILVLNL